MVDANDTLLDNLPNDDGASGYRWVELSALTSDGDFTSFDELRSTDPTWDADQGMGRVYTNVDVQVDRVLLRGGGWNGTSYTGVLAAHLYHPVGINNYDLGFRCAR